MNGNRDEARRAKDLAEAEFAEKNYTLAKKLAQKVQSMCPEIDGISQFLDEVKVGALTDWYNVLGVSPTCGEEIIRRQYRKMALSLHPDKNKSIGSTDAFTIIAEAFDVLSDQKKRSEYDAKRRLNLQREKKNYCNDKSNGDLSSTTCTKAPNHRHDEAPRSTTNKRPSPYPMMPASHNTTGSFWTICTTCMMHHCYGRIFHGKKLMCTSCLNPFSANKVPSPPDGEVTDQARTASNREPSRDNETATKSNSKGQKVAPTCAKPPHYNANSNHQSSSSSGFNAPKCSPTEFGGFRSRWEAQKHATTFHHQHDGPMASHENPNPTGFVELFRSRWEARKAVPSHHQQGFPSSYYRQKPNVADSHHRNSFFPGDGQVSSSSIQPSFYAGQRANSRQQMNMWSSSAGSGLYWSGFHMNLRPNINLDFGSNQHAQIRTEDIMRHSRQVNNNMMKHPFNAEQPEEEGGNYNKRSNAGTERCNISGNKFSNFNNDNGKDPGSGSSTNIGDSLNRRMNHSWKFWSFS